MGCIKGRCKTKVRAVGFQVYCYYEVLFAPLQLRCCSALKVEFTTHPVKLERFF